MVSDNIAAMVEREAAAAEADDGETPGFEAPELREDPEPEPGEPDAPDEPEPPSGPSEAELEKAFKSLERESDRHAKRVAEIMGADFANLQTCPCCQVPGFVFPFQEFSDTDQERRLAILSYLGQGEAPYKDAADKRACEACDGYGEVLSGSRNPTHRVVACSVCQGLGWIQTAATIAAVPAIYDPATVASGVANGGAAPGTPDAWGRPPGSRFYGVAPGFEQ
jgi:hypothetical protein